MQYSDLYLISGVFFQESSGFGLGYKAGEGVVAMLHRGIGQFSYTGTLYRDPHHVLGGYAGTVLDALGHARLTDIVITKTELLFEKRYDNNRPHGRVIHYVFRAGHGSIWKGEYSIPEVGIKGPTNCVLTPITEDFFRHDLVLER